MRFKASDVAAATGGRLIGPDTTIDGASIDSRSVRPDQLFVPIVADRDGHDFIDKAREAGVTTYLTSRGAEGSGTAIEVPDTALALADLGRAARGRLTGPVVGVTGSVGKTSTKDLLASVLATSYVTAANERSFNNELGLPLTLLGARDDTEAVVVEMGARGVGHIALLCDIARPTVGIVTRVEGVHLELFGDIESVARAKGELIEALPDDGLAVLNNDHPLVVAMADRTSATVLRYGFTPDADVYADNISLDDELRGSFTLHSPWGSAAVTLGARGEHQISNALAAVAAAGGIGVPVDRIAAGLGQAAISGLRMELTRTEGGVLILNDAYNANPTSMAAALDSLATLAASRRVAVLGVMAELGESAPAEHVAITERARALGVEVIAVDAPDYGPGARHVATVERAVAALSDLAAGDAVLVKGSRVAALERVAAALTAG
ncbi:UDP-N-acetylmuramoyl-tripeptide--D-alanyl-D-alanine ligase [Williamsia muralis]|uniref:UDP-N-acetylmuramoyl-tripeptide--D-alanyl-D-alanine ligase n=1 Tax=Williamsia marianensis TaxID=85044 RepID=A0A2G3PMP5_WILMA|nr:UDP-N-acetylmuramoyl-tripeptide--D-alanyl-D-alanine ligase [Williamsia marianensis]PHV67051.1 UDP-N-acetylmuramoylalanyl-D-glutamyl-2, 6-diaminopimelate--D-alanyl-D-alanine ligase [Williamsia marianensis]